jgi:hypothetical protein
MAITKATITAAIETKIGTKLLDLFGGFLSKKISFKING